MRKRTGAIGLLWMLSPVASFGQLTWVTTPGTSSSSEIDVTQACPAGRTVVGGGHSLTQYWFMASRVLESTAPSGTTGWNARSTLVEGAPSNPYQYTVSALCATPEVAACVARAEAVSPIDINPSKEVVATCPPGMLAFSGGAEIIGETFNRGFHHLGPGGFLIPWTWVAEVATYDDSISFTGWGVRVFAWCAPVEVFDDHITLMVAFTEDGVGIDSATMLPGYEYAAHAEYRYGDPGMPDLASCTEPLSVGLYGDPGRFVVDLGPKVGGGLAAEYEGRIGSFKEDMFSMAVALCADSLHGFGSDLEASCAETEPDRPGRPGFEIDLSKWQIGGRVMWGLTGGGNGVIFLPGVGPIPVDPEPFREVFKGLPIAVIQYRDRDALGRILHEARRGLAEERRAFVETSAIEDALTTRGLLLVTPADEERAIAWLGAARRRLADRATPVIVFLKEDGPGMGALRSW